MVVEEIEPVDDPATAVDAVVPGPRSSSPVLSSTGRGETGRALAEMVLDAALGGDDVPSFVDRDLGGERGDLVG